jgi:chromosomal replication initiator protein
MQTFASWIPLPENQAARLAVERVADCVGGRGPRRAINPLFLYGPAGTGKTHLVSALLADVTRRGPDLQVALLAAGDFESLLLPEFPPHPNPPPQEGRAYSSPSPLVGEGWGEGVKEARQADLLVVEDLQHLPGRVEEAFVHLMDRGLARGQQLVFTALAGPAQLTHLPARLTSRLSGGLVVGLEMLSPVSRRAFLADRVRRRGLEVGSEVIDWLAGHVAGSVRQLEGALTRLADLARQHSQPLDLDRVAEQFGVEASVARPTVERIVQRVGRYFQVEPRRLQERSRSRSVLLPRQVGMYLARQLTGLSLEQIGAYFGGRDHSTVLHACRKVEQALAHDVHLSGAVRQLHADLA